MSKTWKSKGTDPKELALQAATSEASVLREQVAVLRKENVQLKQREPVVIVAEKEETDFLGTLLALEVPTKEAAANYPSGPNSDAVKSALTNAAHGIAHVRKALKQIAGQR